MPYNMFLYKKKKYMWVFIINTFKCLWINYLRTPSSCRSSLLFHTSGEWVNRQRPIPYIFIHNQIR